MKHFDKLVISINDFIKKVLNNKRYLHSVSVAEIAEKLAKHYGISQQKAKVAGLLHDCSRYMDEKALLEKAIAYGYIPDAQEKRNPKLLHSFVSAYIAKEKFAIEDEEILSAIQQHTTGSALMSLLDKIIYVADYIDPSRELDIITLQKITDFSYFDINVAVSLVLDETIDYLKKNQLEIHQRSLDLNQSLKKSNYII